MTWPEALCYSVVAICALVLLLGFFAALVFGGSSTELIRSTPEREPSIEDDDDDAPFDIPIQRIHPQAVIPRKANSTDAGYDLWATEDVVLRPGEHKLIPTGLKIAIPSGFYGRIAPRSGHSVKGGIATLAGVVDSGYVGELGVVLVNHSDTPYAIPKEKAIAQLIIEAHYDAVWYEVSALDETVRGEGGFGSSDPNLPFN